MTERLRITGGTRRGRKLFSPPRDTIRPASDLVRQAVFNMLGQTVIGATFYDVFAGTGVVGLEALSRGARRAVFIEKERRNLALIRRNLDHIGFGPEGEIRGTDAFAWGRHYRHDQRPTIVFLGPPYPDFETERGRLFELVETIQAKLAGDDVLVLQFPRRVSPGELPNGPGWRRIRAYGKTQVGLWSPADRAAMELGDETERHGAGFRAAPSDNGRNEAMRRFALEVVQRLRSAGFEALWAGGCVRDLLLRRVPKDYDVATSARPKEVQRLFRRTVPVGVSFGVVRVLGPPGIEVEVATFRTDADYSDGRHPDAVRFSTPPEDAQRRDFTINGLFFDPIAERVHDFVGGQADLENRIVRAIGDPARRFAEDKLRLLRTVRFAARYDFAIDPATAAAVRAAADQIAVVSAERILAELRIMLTPPTRVRAIDLLRDLCLFAHVFLEHAALPSNAAEWETTRVVLQHWQQEVSLPLTVAGLLTTVNDSTIGQTADALLRRLKSSNDDRERTVWLAENRRGLDAAASRRLCQLKRLLAHPGAAELLDYHSALATATTGASPDADYCRHLLSQWSPDDLAPTPFITGADLIALGLEPGPIFKDLLDRLYDEQLDGAIHSKEQAIEKLAEIRQSPAALRSRVEQ